MRRQHIIVFLVLVFISWNILMYFMLVNKSPDKAITVQERLTWMEADIKHQLAENDNLLKQLRALRVKEKITQTPKPKQTKLHEDTPVKKVAQPTAQPTVQPVHPRTINLENLDSVVLPILMIACDRVTVSRSLDQLIKYRKSPERFPIIVSQDCGHKPTADVIQKYVKDHGVIHLKQPDLSKIILKEPKAKKFVGYYMISRHYKWAMNQIFWKFNYTAVIIVEDDLDISPDFFEYFSATFPILAKEPSLYCVSAWNDNGKGAMVSNDSELLYRSDFFPGLGWMMTGSLWDEIGPKWPESFWDDWMRHPDQRKGRECIRPEVCRTSTFGKKGVSKGLFYEKHLKFIKLNSIYVPFTKKDLSYLYKDKYDPMFKNKVYNTPEVSLGEVLANRHPKEPALRVTYTTKITFQTAAKKLGIMEDFKAGVPRTAYMGVVSFMYKGQRIYLAPKSDWTKYDVKWT